jgi:hypothetical protein
MFIRAPSTKCVRAKYFKLYLVRLLPAARFGLCLDLTVFLRTEIADLRIDLCGLGDMAKEPRGPIWHFEQKKLLRPATMALRIIVPQR